MEKEFTVEELIPQEDRAKYIFWGAIIFGLSFMLAGVFFIYFEISGAKHFCDSIDGEYDLRVFPLPGGHYCDGEEIVKYNKGKGWDFESLQEFSINLSEISD
jgi:hypothetical protein